MQLALEELKFFSKELRILGVYHAILTAAKARPTRAIEGRARVRPRRAICCPASFETRGAAPRSSG